jgi:hypothetical protein
MKYTIGPITTRGARRRIINVHFFPVGLYRRPPPKEAQL